jgi:hypothetical protein
MIKCKGFGRKQSWHNFNVLSRHSPGGSDESHKKNSLGIAGLRAEI